MTSVPSPPGVPIATATASAILGRNRGYLDLNGNGVYDAGIDLPLPNADSAKPDVYVQYDWMGWAPPGNACDTDAYCASWGPGHDGETCTGPKVTADKAGSCVFACKADADCTSRGQPAQRYERCINKVCEHTYDPEILAPGALAAVSQSFADHGINLHIIRGHEVPHSFVTSFRRNNEMTDTCEGGSTLSGSAGIGKYAVSLYDLKSVSAIDKLNVGYHYALFSNRAGCDTSFNCGRCPAAYNPDGTPKAPPDPIGASGIAEISGNDFIVSLGNFFQDNALTPGLFSVGTTFMHELGHNLGLHHGGGIEKPCATDADCRSGATCTPTILGKTCQGQSDDIAYKTNYLSLMNYAYQWMGITPAAPDGSNSPIACLSDGDCPTRHYCNLTSPPGFCARLDFSNEVLPTGGRRPGILDQTDLDEQAGLGSQRAPDIFYFADLAGGLADAPWSPARTVGPVDWDGDGDYDNPHVRADTRCGIDHPCDMPDYTPLAGHADWGPAAPYPFNYKFQCTPYGGPFGDGATWSRLTSSMSVDDAKKAHVLYPPREVKVSLVTAGYQPIDITKALGQEYISVVIYGAADLNVADIDQSSLALHGAKPVSISRQ